MRRNWHYPFLIVLLCIACALLGFTAGAAIVAHIPPLDALVAAVLFALVGMSACLVLVTRRNRP